MSLVTIIGRGHSGTRAMSHTLSASGVFMGMPQNESGDLLPPEPIYEAARLFARYVDYKGGLEWDWSRAFSAPIPQQFIDLIEKYLISLSQATVEFKGWKIPETTLVYPWIQRMFPEAKYIFWVRNPRDSIMGAHITDDLHDWGIDYPQTGDQRLKRAYSWMYQYQLVKATPKPASWIEIRFEDFVLEQESTLARLEQFMGFPLARVTVKKSAVGRYLHDDGLANYYDFFSAAMQEYHYEPRIEKPG